MTFANILATGSGRPRARLSIAGLPADFVSAKNMEVTGGGATRGRIAGLDPKTIHWSHNGDLIRARLAGEGFTATMKDFGGLVSLVLGKRPQQTTALRTQVNTSATTIPVFDTSGFAAEGVIHIDTEAIEYKAKNATNFLNCVRGIWGTTAQYHYIATDAEDAAETKVTDHPEGLEGRAATLSLYGDGDTGTGDGTVAFRGVCNRGARFEDGTWTIGIDPITRILDQAIGGDISEPVPIRGITYTDAAPRILVIAEDDASGSGDSCEVVVTGHFESEAEFCETFTALITTGTAGFAWAAGSSIVAIPEPGGFALVYTVGAAGPAYRIRLDTLHFGASAGARRSRVSTSEIDAQIGTGWSNADGTPSEVPANGETLTAHFAAAFPRATVGDARGAMVVIPDVDPLEIYLGGGLIPTTDMLVFIEGAGTDPVPAEITAVDAVNRTITVNTPFTVLGPGTTLRIGRVLDVTATVNDLRATLIANSPQHANTGAMPFLTSVDILSAPEVNQAALANRAIGWGRTFVAFDSMTLAELFEPELRALGCYPRIGSGGSIEWKRIRASVTTDTADWTIGDEDLARGTKPTLERGLFGIISEVQYKTGWDPKENEHNGQLYRFRDVGAAAPNRISKVLEIAQRSLAPSSAEEVAFAGDLTITDVRRAAMPVLGLFGTEYDIIQIAVGMRFFSVKIGDNVSLTTPRITSTDGTRGVTNELCMVTSAGVDLSTAVVSLQLLRHGQRVRGYAPEFRITASSLVAGTTYDLTVNIADYTDAASVHDWFVPGDLVQVREEDVVTPSTAGATVAAIQPVSATVIRVTFAGAFAFSGEWSIGCRDSADYAQADQLSRFMFVASTTRRVSFTDGDVDAMVFAP